MPANIRLKLISLISFFIMANLCCSAEDFYLRSDDRVVFFGDSITEQRLYTNFIEHYVRTRFPQQRIQFWNAGVGGDSVRGGWAGEIDTRLRRDVIAYKPTVVTIMLGMNDGGVAPLTQVTFERFKSGFVHIIETLKRELPGVRITVLQPSAYDDVTRPELFPGGYNYVLKQFGKFIAEYGAREGLTIVDANTALTSELERALQRNGEAAKFLVPDRVHPGAAGHWAIALAVLKKWNAPSVVSDVELNGTDVYPMKSKNTRISGLQGGAKRLTWTQLDEALPLDLAFDNIETEIAQQFLDINTNLNLQRLRIVQLPVGEYVLKIDGKVQGRFSSQKLAAGVDLSTLSTPMKEQSAAVNTLIYEHNDIHIWRVHVEVDGNGSNASVQAAEYLEQMEKAKESKANIEARPRPHTYELVKVSTKIAAEPRRSHP